MTCREPEVAERRKRAQKGKRPLSNPRRGPEQRDAGIVPNGAVAIRGERIIGVGATEDILPAFRGEDTSLIDASGKTVTPGLVDAHTHLAWAGWRDEEYELRLKGATYLEIMEAGGGIMSTVRATRLGSEAELKELMRERIGTSALLWHHHGRDQERLWAIGRGRNEVPVGDTRPEHRSAGVGNRAANSSHVPGRTRCSRGVCR